VLNVISDDVSSASILLPPSLRPKLKPTNESRGAVQFYLLKDGKTGVLVLSAFEDEDTPAFLKSLLEGLESLKSQGATRLILDLVCLLYCLLYWRVDFLLFSLRQTTEVATSVAAMCVKRNYVVIAPLICKYADLQWLRRIVSTLGSLAYNSARMLWLMHTQIVGPKPTVVPQAGLDSAARAGPLAQLIVKKIVANPAIDFNLSLLYNPLNWVDANNRSFAATENWLQPPIQKVINGRQDAFSQRYVSFIFNLFFLLGRQPHIDAFLK
jgi:hypothetical protein